MESRIRKVLPLREYLDKFSEQTLEGSRTSLLVVADDLYAYGLIFIFGHLNNAQLITMKIGDGRWMLGVVDAFLLHYSCA